MPDESPVATTNDTLTLDSAQSKRDYIPKVLPVFKSGAYVDAKRKEDNNWYPGLISSVQYTVVNSAGKNEESPRGRKKIVTYNILFDDGDREPSAKAGRTSPAGAPIGRPGFGRRGPTPPRGASGGSR